MRKLQQYLEEYEFFEEIVVLKNQHVTTENLEYFLHSYFPSQLERFPNSRFLFALVQQGRRRG